MEDGRGQDDKVSREIWEIIKTETGKTGMAEAVRREEERRSRKKKRRKGRKTKEAEESKNNGYKESS